jgi:hypothetical protein
MSFFQNEYNYLTKDISSAPCKYYTLFDLHQLQLHIPILLSVGSLYSGKIRPDERCAHFAQLLYLFSGLNAFFSSSF